MIFKGDSIEFNGSWTQDQVLWAQTDEPTDLIVGEVYVAEFVEVRPWATRVKLVGQEGVFNSVHFRVV